MDALTIYGLSDVTVGTVLVVAWLVLLVGGVVRYRNGSRSRQWLYRTGTMACPGLAYGLMQVITVFDAVVKNVLGLFSLVLILLGIASGIRWRRARHSGENPETSG